MFIRILAFVAVFFLGTTTAQAQTVNRRATLNWTAPTVCKGGAALSNCVVVGYSIQRLMNNEWTQVGTTAANVLTYTEQNLSLGTHTYRVLANSAGGPSDPSNEVSKSFDVPGAPGNLVITVTITIT